MAQSDERRCANEPRHMAAKTRAAVGVEFEQLAPQHVRQQFIPPSAFCEIDPAPCQPLDTPSVIRARSYVGEDEMRDPLRPCGCKRKCRASSQRKADNGNLVVREPIEDAGEVAREMSSGITAGIVRRVALPMATLVVGDDGVAIG